MGPVENKKDNSNNNNINKNKNEQRTQKTWIKCIIVKHIFHVWIKNRRPYPDQRSEYQIQFSFVKYTEVKSLRLYADGFGSLYIATLWRCSKYVSQYAVKDLKLYFQYESAA